MRASNAVRLAVTGGAIALLPLISCGLGGCSTADHAQTDSAKQDQALNDPMNYKVDPPDVTNRNTGSFDHQGFNRDMNDLVNP